MIKTLKRLWVERMSRHNKSRLWPSHSKHPTHNARWRDFPLRSRMRQVCPNHNPPGILQGIPARSVRGEEEIQGIQLVKEKVKWSLFADNMVLYVKKPQDFTKTPVRTNRQGIQQSFKVYTEKSVAFLYKNNEQTVLETEGKIPFAIASNWVKSLGITFTGEVKVL